MFWNKKKVEPPLQFNKARELTGIEKHEREEAVKRTADWKKEHDAKQAEILARIGELREQIKPQTDEIRTLEMSLYPAQYFGYAMQSQNQLQAASGLSSLSSLLGFGGVLHQ